MTDARAALAPLYEAMDILDGAADTQGTRAAVLKAICRSVAFLERERDRRASLPAAPAGWREPFMPADLETEEEATTEWMAKVLRNLAAQLSFANDFFYPLIGVAKHLELETEAAAPSAPAPSGGVETRRPDWMTKRVIPHEEARQIAQRFIDRHFKNVDKEWSRASIPASPERDDDLLLMAYIWQQEHLAATPPAQVAPGVETQLRNIVLTLVPFVQDRVRDIQGNFTRNSTNRIEAELLWARLAADLCDPSLFPVNPLATPPASAEKTATGGGE